MASVASVLPPLLLPGPGGSVGRAEPRMLLSFRSLGSGSESGSWVGRRQERPASRGSSVLVRSFEVSGPGALDSPLISSMKLKIQQQLSTDDVVVRDERGDGRHVSIQVVAAAFEGQSRVNRQRMVYKAIWEELQGVVHAVDQLTTKTPAEAAKDTLSP